MKVAVPTVDGQTITREFESAGAFLVMTFKAGEVVKEDLRKLRFSEIINFEDSFAEKLNDCQYVFVREIDEENCDTLKELEIQCIKTTETQVSSIISQCKEVVTAKKPEPVLVLNHARSKK